MCCHIKNKKKLEGCVILSIVGINTLFKHFLQSDRPHLSSACTRNHLSNVPSTIFNLKRNRPRNLREQVCNHREEVVQAGCKLLWANCQSKYQHCSRSLQSCAEKNIRFDCKSVWVGSPTHALLDSYIPVVTLKSVWVGLLGGEPGFSKTPNFAGSKLYQLVQRLQHTFPQYCIVHPYCARFLTSLISAC